MAVAGGDLAATSPPFISEKTYAVDKHPISVRFGVLKLTPSFFFLCKKETGSLTVDNLAATLLLLSPNRNCHMKTAPLNKIKKELADILISSMISKKYHRKWIRNVSCRGAQIYPSSIRFHSLL